MRKDANTVNDMARKSDDNEIPHYLCYTREGIVTDSDGSRLNGANAEVHRRLLCRSRDSLCERCACYDFTNLGGIHDIIEGDVFRSDLHLHPWSYVKATEDFSTLGLLADRPIWNRTVTADGGRRCQFCDLLVDLFQDCRGSDKSVISGLKFRIEEKHLFYLRHPRDHVCSKSQQYEQIAKILVSSKATHVEFTVRPFLDALPVVKERRAECPSSIDSGQQLLVDLPHSCVTRRLVSDKVDFDLINDWIRQCDENHQHGQQRKAGSTDTLPHVRSIDIKNQCIIRGTLQSRYAALSYIWGFSKQYLLTKERLPLLEKRDALILVKEDLPEVVRDAITACEKMDIPFLWIDALCIVQDNPDEKHSQVANMDSIYSMAYTTLVAAEGKDANAGLPRVSVPRKTKAKKLKVDKVTYIVAEEVGRSLERSKWSTRGWTFQELVLSTRIVVFTSTETFFYCPEGLVSESTCPRNNPRSFLSTWTPPIAGFCNMIVKQQRSHANSQQEFLMDDGQRKTLNVQLDSVVEAYKELHVPLLNEYLRRDLTYKDDRLAAFSGILSAEEDILGTFRWGLPCKLLARALLWELSFSETTGRISTSRNAVSCTPIRYPEFPSWSWTGWTFPSSTKLLGGPELYKRPTSKMTGSQEIFPLVHIFEITQNGDLASLLGPRNPGGGIEGHDISSIKSINKILSQKHQLVLDTVPVLPTQDLGVPQSHALVFWASVATFRVSKRGKDSHNTPELDHYGILGCADRTVQLREKWRESQPDTMEFVLIAEDGETGTNNGSLHSILIERDGNVARRVAVASRMTRYQWLTGRPENKLIVLA